MKNNKYKKVNRIALISIAAAALMACSSLTAYAADSSTSAADTRTKVVYTGDGTTTSTVAVENAENLDAFKNLMPGGSTKPQEITIQNKSGQNMQVYFRAEPTAGENNTAIAQKLLEELQLKITFKMDDGSATQTLYQGPASGKLGTTTVTDIVSKQISLGYVYGKSDSGILSATLTAPETLKNQYQLSTANINWNFQFQLADPIASVPHNGGGGHGGNGGTPIAGTESTVSTEVIGTDSTPQVGPTGSSSFVQEDIPNESVPLSRPPKTGQDAAFLWMVIAGAAVAIVVFAVARRKIKHEA